MSALIDTFKTKTEGDCIPPFSCVLEALNLIAIKD